jgi:shikimate dehydrogenase
MTRLAGIFGYPLDHSISPRFQQAAFDHCSLDVSYKAWPVAANRLEPEVRKLRDDGYLGANVTTPHKERIRPYLNDLEPLARALGAVNTIVKEDDRLVGYNTDAHGLMEALRKDGACDPKGLSVLVLGAGGAARAAVFSLVGAGVASLTIANRTLARAESLASEFEAASAGVEAVPMEGPALAGACKRADLIVNTTSMGMRHGMAERETPLKAGTIRAQSLVYDLVYNPAETPLLVEAKAAGAQTLGGLPMLVYQGAASFELWTGSPAPIEVMFEAARKALA